MTKGKARGMGLCLAAAALAGCGGGGAADGGGNTAPAPPPQSEQRGATSGKPVATIDVRETEMKIDPATPTIPRPGVVEFRVENAGQVVHALEVEGPRGEVETDEIQPGKSAVLRANLSEPGEYTWYCPVGNHQAQGMRGRITVERG